MKCFKPVFRITFLFLLFIHHSSPAQSIYREGFHQLTCPEKRWVLFHPFIAKEAYRLTQEARAAAKEMSKSSSLDGDENGGQVDAFRHAYWMALLSQNIAWKKARRLSKAHEKGNYKDFKKRKMEEGTLPDSISGQMDLFNNEMGIAIGRKYKSLSKEELIHAVRDSVISGKMKIIRKDLTGAFLDCEGNKIDTLQFQYLWNVPKCLVESDFNNRH